jgi:hypothetical protein
MTGPNNTGEKVVPRLDVNAAELAGRRFTGEIGGSRHN